MFRHNRVGDNHAVNNSHRVHNPWSPREFLLFILTLITIGLIILLLFFIGLMRIFPPTDLHSPEPKGSAFDSAQTRMQSRFQTFHNNQDQSEAEKFKKEIAEMQLGNYFLARNWEDFRKNISMNNHSCDDTCRGQIIFSCMTKGLLTEGLNGPVEVTSYQKSFASLIKDKYEDDTFEKEFVGMGIIINNRQILTTRKVFDSKREIVAENLHQFKVSFGSPYWFPRIQSNEYVITDVVYGSGGFCLVKVRPDLSDFVACNVTENILPPFERILFNGMLSSIIAPSKSKKRFGRLVNETLDKAYNAFEIIRIIDNGIESQDQILGEALLVNGSLLGMHTGLESADSSEKDLTFTKLSSMLPSFMELMKNESRRRRSRQRNVKDFNVKNNTIIVVRNMTSRANKIFKPLTYYYYSYCLFKSIWILI